MRILVGIVVSIYYHSSKHLPSGFFCVNVDGFFFAKGTNTPKTVPRVTEA